MIKAIIFDKDGTLIDLGNTWDEPTIHAMDVMMELTDLSLVEKIKFKQKMGVEATYIVPNSLVAAGSISEQAALLSEVVPLPITEIALKLEQLYLDYIVRSDVELNVIAHAESTLKALKENYVIGLVTNDNRSITEASLAKAGLNIYFDYIACADDFKPKPDPIALHDLSEKYGIQLDEMIYVGDSSVDMIYGKYTQAAIGFALEDEHLVHLSEADYIIRSFEQLPAIIQSINKGKKE